MMRMYSIQEKTNGHILGKILPKGQNLQNIKGKAMIEVHLFIWEESTIESWSWLELCYGFYFL